MTVVPMFPLSTVLMPAMPLSLRIFEERYLKLLGDLQFGPDTALSDNPMDACWQLAGVLPVGGLDQVELLQSQSADELISRTYDLVISLDEALKGMAGELGSDEEEL
jgi:hypothetical protein